MISANAALRSIAEVEYLDMHGRLGADDLFDGVHPNSAGMMKIVAAVRERLGASAR